MSSVAVNHKLQGPEDAPVVVLGNSLGTDLTMWDEVAELLAGSYRLVRYDHRGQGSSPAGAELPTVAELGADVLALLDQLGIAKAAYAGVSIGGMTAQWLAANAPDRITTAAVFCSSSYTATPDPWIARAAAVRDAGSVAPIAEAVVGRWITAPFAQDHPQARERLLTLLRSSPADGYADLCEMLAQLDLRADNARTEIPVLVVACAQDQALPPAESELIAATISSSDYVLLDPGAHIPMVERPADVAALIRKQLEATT